MEHTHDFVFIIPVHVEFLDIGWEAFRILDNAVCNKIGAAEVHVELIEMARENPPGTMRFVLGGHVVRRRHVPMAMEDPEPSDCHWCLSGRTDCPRHAGSPLWASAPGGRRVPVVPSPRPELPSLPYSGYP